MEGKVTPSRCLQLDRVNNDPAWEGRYAHARRRNHPKDKEGLTADVFVLRETDEPESDGAELTSFELVDLT